MPAFLAVPPRAVEPHEILRPREGGVSWVNVLGLAVGLSMDALAVSIAAGLTIERLTGRHVFRLAWHFGLFQFLMPVIGWLAGTTLAGCLAAWGHWAAAALVTCIAGKMLWQSFAGGQERIRRGDPTRGWTLVMLSTATSVDALGAGMSLAFLGVSIWVPSVVIGLVAGGLTCIGIRFGQRLGAYMSRWAELLGGLVLLAVAVRIALSA